MKTNIVAGPKEDINEHSDDWLIVDIGFSSRQPSCGFWNRKGKPRAVTFGKLLTLATEEVQNDGTPPRTLNLLIEAPLSLAFQQNNNPSRRSCDEHGDQHRDCYVNAGATTLIAAGYLLGKLVHCHGQREIRLFEGFVSFKRSEAGRLSDVERKATHIEDVLKLKNAVWSKENAEFFAPSELAKNSGDRIESAFPFWDPSLIPPVIRVNPSP